MMGNITPAIIGIGATIAITIMGGMFTWIHKLDSRMFDMSQMMVDRSDLTKEINTLVNEMRAVEARLERSMVHQGELSRRRAVEAGGQ